MFDFDYGKLVVIGLVALIVIGPKDLPRVLRQIGAAIGKMRRMASEFQTQFSEALRDSELEELKKDMKKIADDAKVDINYDPVAETNREMREAIDGKQDGKKDAKATPPGPGGSTPQTASPAPLNPAPGADPDHAFIDVDIPAFPAQATAAGPVTPGAVAQAAEGAQSTPVAPPPMPGPRSDHT